jgi:tetratricopeptide (TPR) repeat protein
MSEMAKDKTKVSQYMRKTQRLISMNDFDISHKCDNIFSLAENFYDEKQKKYIDQLFLLRLHFCIDLISGNSRRATGNLRKLLKVAAGNCPILYHHTALLECSEMYEIVLNNKKAKELATEALLLARKHNFPHLQSEALTHLARLNRYRRNYKAALALVREALRVIQPFLTGYRLKAMVEKGSILIALGDYEGALDLFEEIEREALGLNLYDLLIKVAIYQADIFRTVGDLDKSREYLTKAMRISKQFKVFFPESEFGLQMGFHLLHKNNYEQALSCFIILEEQLTVMNWKITLPYVYLGCSSAYNGLENYKKAKKNCLKALDLIAPDYLFNCDILNQVLMQLQFSLRHLNQESKCKHVIDLSRRIDELTSSDIDNANSKEQLLNMLKDDISELIKSLKSNRPSYFTRKGIRVNLEDGAIYRLNKYPQGYLSDIQLLIFNILIKNMGHPVSHYDIVDSYTKNEYGMTGFPRRSHYFVGEIRKKLGVKSLIIPYRGKGYMIPAD